MIKRIIAYAFVDARSENPEIVSVSASREQLFSRYPEAESEGFTYAELTANIECKGKRFAVLARNSGRDAGGFIMYSNRENAEQAAQSTPGFLAIVEVET